MEVLTTVYVFVPSKKLLKLLPVRENMSGHVALFIRFGWVQGQLAGVVVELLTFPSGILVRKIQIH